MVFAYYALLLEAVSNEDGGQVSMSSQGMRLGHLSVLSCNELKSVGAYAASALNKSSITS